MRGKERACLYTLSLVSGQLSLNKPKVRLKERGPVKWIKSKAGLAAGIIIEALFEVTRVLKLERGEN